MLSEEASGTATEDEPVPRPVSVQEMSEKEMLRQKMVQDYRAFANGGAQEHDARLHARATAKGKGKRKKFTAKIAIGDLLGDDPLSVDASPVSYSVSGSAGAREQGLGDSHAQESSQSVPQGSLLD